MRCLCDIALNLAFIKTKLSQNISKTSVENQKSIAGDILELCGSVQEANAESALEIAALLQQTKIATLIAKL